MSHIVATSSIKEDPTKPYTPSDELLRMNASLVAKRKPASAQKVQSKVPVVQVAQPLVLPSWLARTAPAQTVHPISHFFPPNKAPLQPAVISPSQPLQAVLSTQPTMAENLTLHPALAVAILNSETAVNARLWLVARHLDNEGGGMWHIADLIERFTKKTSVYRICGPRRLKQILKSGAGVFWQRDNQGRLFFRSLAHVLAALSKRPLSGNPVSVPITALLGGMQKVRATLYAVFHAGRHANRPLSRATLETILGVSGRAQRNYDKVAGVKKDQQTAVGPRWEQSKLENAYWQHRGVFKYRQRNKDGSITNRIAWRLPNQYTASFKQAGRGGLRKLTQAVQVLVTKRAQDSCEQANSSPRETLLFCQSATELKKQMLVVKEDVYWYEGGVWLQMNPER